MNVNICSVNEFYKARPDKFVLLADKDFAENIERLTRLEGFTHFNTPEKIQYGCGAWAECDLTDQKIATFGQIAHHLEGMSTKESASWEVEYPDSVTKKIVQNLPVTYPVYDIPSFEGLRPLVCIVSG